ncbi:MAG TPA: 3-deoxy-manno-octulosonate cytidylyltransferase [Longimicrobiales bacterium]|nr:3-deoxy-manno-octulosonate cytidylyltransferase [Longimicrobiales bacterium]
MSAVLGVIPARLGSERLPRKPLRPIAGRPLIEWVWRRAREVAATDRLVVATDATEVLAACERFGAEAVLTSADHRSGTDRVAEVAALPSFGGFDVILNIQGDEPFVSRDAVTGAVGMVAEGWDVGTVAAPLGATEALGDPDIVKVVRNDRGGALYFSRAPIPHLRGGEPGPADLASGFWLRHIGIYAFTPGALRRWVALPEGRLERIERLEQLRPLAAGLGIGVAVVDEAEGGIDTPEDAARAEARLRRQAETMEGETGA